MPTHAADPSAQYVDPSVWPVILIGVAIVAVFVAVMWAVAWLVLLGMRVGYREWKRREAEHATPRPVVRQWKTCRVNSEPHFCSEVDALIAQLGDTRPRRWSR